LVFYGHGGIGKSRLSSELEQLLRAAPGEHFTHIQTRCDQRNRYVLTPAVMGIAGPSCVMRYLGAGRAGQGPCGLSVGLLSV
jgi:nitrogenase subunit NifH